MIVLPIKTKDKDKVRHILKNRWGSEKIVYERRIYLADQLPGFMVLENSQAVGLITYRVNNKICQIITIDALIKRKGIGTALINQLKKEAKIKGWKKIKVITTNDNLDGLRFYQRRGFVLNKVYKKAVDKSRKLKPEIPKMGEYKIPIRDEIELELELV